MHHLANNPIKSPSHGWMMVICACLFYCFQFLLRVSPAVLTEDLKASFMVNSCELGFLSACYYNAYALMQIPIGILLDRFNVRTIIATSCGVATLGTIIFALSDSLIQAGIGRFMMGMGAACGFIGTLKIISICIDKRFNAHAIALTMVFGTCGGTLGSAPLAWLASLLTWQNTLLCIAGFGIILTGLLFCFLSPLGLLIGRTQHESIQHGSTPQESKWASISRQFSKIIKVKQFWFLSLFGLLMYVPLAAFADLWGPAFLALKLNIDPIVAASLTSVIYLGVCGGAPVASLIAQKLKSFKVAMIISSVLLTVFFHIVVYTPSMNIKSLGGLLLFVGISFGGQCLVFSALNEKVSVQSYGFASGFMNMIIMMSGVVFEPLVGSLLDQTATLNLVTYQNAMQPILVALCAAVILSFFITVKYPRHR